MAARRDYATVRSEGATRAMSARAAVAEYFAVAAAAAASLVIERVPPDTTFSQQQNRICT